MKTHLFAYGTLRVGKIMHAVSGQHYNSQPATLKDYACYCVKNATYPGIIAQPGRKTVGCIYFDITDISWKRLDAFEGDMYKRIAVTVHTYDGNPQRAQVYVISPAHDAALSSERWTLDEFTAHGQDIFMKTYFADRRPGN